MDIFVLTRKNMDTMIPQVGRSNKNTAATIRVRQIDVSGTRHAPTQGGSPRC